ncbi:hypothetical protein PMIN06_007267 [Paraphaeosphaeria minitans]
MQTPSESDKRLPYRRGMPILPVLPLETHEVPLPPELARIRQPIRDIPSDESVYRKHWAIVKRVRRDQNPADAPWTLLVHAYTDDGRHLARWEAVTQRLHLLLCEANVHCYMEILDEAYDEGMRTSWLDRRSHRSALDVWPMAAHHVLSLMKTQNWVSLSCVSRRPASKDGEGHPTVLIWASDADDEFWWNELTPRLKEDMDLLDLNIELVHSKELTQATCEAKKGVNDSNPLPPPTTIS